MKMNLHASGEDYLEAIIIINNRKGYVLSDDVGGVMDYSKPSVSHAASLISHACLISVDENGYLN